MPQKRRPSAPAARAAQSTLSFGTQHKVTKPVTEPPAKKHKSLPERTPTKVVHLEPTPAEIELEASDDEREIVEDAEVKEPEVEAEVDPIKEKASSISKSAIEVYWRGIQAQRKAPRGIFL
jgi:DNA polymerase delta subunit 4